MPSCVAIVLLQQLSYEFQVYRIADHCDRTYKRDKAASAKFGKKSKGCLMSEKQLLVPMELIEKKILIIRRQKIIVDADLAELYGVSTKRLNEQVKRNRDRFPKDFMFQLTKEEKAGVVANCDHLSKLKYSATLPNAFTEHGAIMVAAVLNTERAVQVSLFVVRAFVKLREVLATHKDLMWKIEEMEKKYDAQLKVVFEAIRQLMSKPDKSSHPIGFKVDKR